MSVVTLSSEGKIALPEELRHALGLQKGDRLLAILEGDRLVLTRLSLQQQPNWQRWRGRLAGTQALQEHLAEHADEVRRERLP